MSKELATILLGERAVGVREQTFALLTDKPVRITEHFSADNYRLGIENIGEEYGNLLKELGVSNYTIINGQRIRMSTYEQVVCEELPQEAVCIFLQGLRKVFGKE